MLRRLRLVRAQRMKIVNAMLAFVVLIVGLATARFQRRLA